MSGPVDVQVRLDTRAAERRLVLAARALDDISGAWPEVVRWTSSRQRDIWSRGGRPRWKTLSGSYARSRRTSGFGGSILVRSGAMRGAYTHVRAVKSSHHYVVVGPTNPPHYARWHVQGTTSMPKRNPMPGFNASDRRAVRQIIARYVERRLA